MYENTWAYLKDFEIVLWNHDSLFILLLSYVVHLQVYNHTGYMESVFDSAAKPPVQVCRKDWSIYKGDTQDHTAGCQNP